MEMKIKDSLGKPVFAEFERGIVGKLIGAVINPDNGRVEALMVKRPFTQARYLLSTRDIVNVTAYVVTEKANDLLKPDELVRADQILKEGSKIIGAAVYTQSGQKLGKVNDYAVDTLSWMLAKIYVKKLFWKLTRNGYDIPYGQIVKIEPGKIIVKDAFVQSKVRQAAYATSR